MLGTPESERLKVSALNLFRPTASPLVPKSVFFVLQHSLQGRGDNSVFSRYPNFNFEWPNAFISDFGYLVFEDFLEFEIWILVFQCLLGSGGARWGPESNVTFSDGVFDKIGGFIQVEFLHNIRTMVIDGENTDEEEIRNLLARFSLSN